MGRQREFVVQSCILNIKQLKIQSSKYLSNKSMNKYQDSFICPPTILHRCKVSSFMYFVSATPTRIQKRACKCVHSLNIYIWKNTVSSQTIKTSILYSGVILCWKKSPRQELRINNALNKLLQLTENQRPNKKQTLRYFYGVQHTRMEAAEIILCVPEDALFRNKNRPLQTKHRFGRLFCLLCPTIGDVSRLLLFGFNFNSKITRYNFILDCT